MPVLQFGREIRNIQADKKNDRGVDTREVNSRMMYRCERLDRGYGALKNFSLFLDSPSSMTRKNYRKTFKRLNLATKDVAYKSMADAAKQLKDVKTQSPTKDGCAVLLDGTWQKRGYASHHGIVSCISVDTGKCLDVEVLSNIHKACSAWETKDKESDAYMEWKLKHVCKIDHKGSASSMESVGATRTFSRSEPIHDLQYTKYLGDGDSASFKKVVRTYPESCWIKTTLTKKC